MINYHLIQRDQPGIAVDGEKKFYADISRGRKVNLDQLANRISEISLRINSKVFVYILAIYQV